MTKDCMLFLSLSEQCKALKKWNGRRKASGLCVPCIPCQLHMFFPNLSSMGLIEAVTVLGNSFYTAEKIG